MDTLRHAGPLVLLFATLGADAQVHRCGDSNVYTDKPCENAEPVDLRANVVSPVPAAAAPPAPAAQPEPARILPNMSRVTTSAPAAPSSVWQDKDSRDAAATSRTTGTR